MKSFLGRVKRKLKTVLNRFWFFLLPLNKKRVDILGPMPGDDSALSWGDLYFCRSMKAAFECQGYKCRIVPRENWYRSSNAKYVVVLRGLYEYWPIRKKKKKFIMWNISHPADVPVEEYNLYDFVFFASEKMHRRLADQIAVPSGVLLQCCDPADLIFEEETVKRPELIVEEEGVKRPELIVEEGAVKRSKRVFEEESVKRPELLFVGNSRGVYRKILQDFLPTDHQLTVYGDEWDAFPVKDYVAARLLPHEHLGQAYHDAAIVLNDHWDDMRENGILSNRIFDALCAGGFVLSDYLPEIEEVFEGTVATYRTPEELKEKIDYYLAREDERRQLSAKGQEIVRTRHTFDDRIREMVRVMEKMD